MPVKKKEYTGLAKERMNGKEMTEEEFVMAAYRQTIDYIQVNSRCVPLVGQMPFQDTALEVAQGCGIHGVFDFVSGFTNWV